MDWRGGVGWLADWLAGWWLGGWLLAATQQARVRPSWLLAAIEADVEVNGPVGWAGERVWV